MTNNTKDILITIGLAAGTPLAIIAIVLMYNSLQESMTEKFLYDLSRSTYYARPVTK